jgi:hypothetical protein
LEPVLGHRLARPIYPSTKLIPGGRGCEMMRLPRPNEGCLSRGVPRTAPVEGRARVTRFNPVPWSYGDRIGQAAFGATARLVSRASYIHGPAAREPRSLVFQLTLVESEWAGYRRWGTRMAGDTGRRRYDVRLVRSPLPNLPAKRSECGSLAVFEPTPSACVPFRENLGTPLAGPALRCHMTD